MKTQYYTACSLDGFIATDDHSLEWLFQLGDIAETGYPEFIREVGALAMDSSTYEWTLRHFTEQDSDSNWPYAQPCWIFSSKELPVVRGIELHFVNGNVRPVHDDMRGAAQGKNIWLVGGGELVGFPRRRTARRTDYPAWFGQTAFAEADCLPTAKTHFRAAMRDGFCRTAVRRSTP